LISNRIAKRRLRQMEALEELTQEELEALLAAEGVEE